MGLLPDLRFSPYVKPYVGSANKEFEGVLSKKITDYDVAKSQDDILGLQTDTLLESVAPFSKDREQALKLQDMFRKRIEDRVSKGNYEDMVTSTGRDAREFMKRIQPFQENYKRYADYITGIDKEVQEGNIDRETAEATKRFATNPDVYGGLDLNNVSSTLFRGIQPGRKFDVTDFINKIGNDWEANKGSVEVELPNGRIVKKKWDQLTPKELQSGFQRALAGNREFKSYAETQGMVGLGEKLQNEVANAMTFGMQKYSKKNVETGIDYVPEWRRDELLTLDAYNNLSSVPNTPLMNPKAVNLLDGLSYDKATGTAGINKNEYLVEEDGQIYKYVDSEGNLITKKDVRARDTDTSNIKRRQVVSDSKFSKEQIAQLNKNEYKKVPATKAEIDQLNIRNNAIFDQIIKDAEVVNQRSFVTPESKERVFNTYQKAIKNLQTIVSNRRLQIGVDDKFRANGVDQRIAADPSGRKIFIKSSDPALSGILKDTSNEKGVDFNAIREALFDSDDQWQITEIKGGGIDLVNTYGDQPSADLRIEVKNKDGKTAVIKVGAEMTSTEGQAIQPLQDVMSLYARGTSGTVRLPNGYSFKVNTGVNVDTEKMLGQVQVIDDKGNTIDAVSIDTFDNYYINMLTAQDQQVRAAGLPSITEQLFGSVKKFGK